MLHVAGVVVLVVVAVVVWWLIGFVLITHGIDRYADLPGKDYMRTDPDDGFDLFIMCLFAAFWPVFGTIILCSILWSARPDRPRRNRLSEYTRRVQSRRAAR